MKFMSFQWRAFSQDDLEEALLAKEIGIKTFSYQFAGIHHDPYLYRHFKSVMESGGYDAVISWNFWPVIAEVCKDIGIPYIAWVYDCPVSYEIMPWAQYPTSYLMIFDKAECEKYRRLGAAHAYHMPLAVNTKRIDNICLTEAEAREFEGAEVAFLGTMYESEYSDYKDAFTGWEKGFLDAIIDAQGEFFGDLIFDDVISDTFLDTIMVRWNESGILRSENREDLRAWVYSLLGKERTRRDRIGMLNKIGEKYKTRYYSYKHYAGIKNAEFHAPLNYHEDMFKMFKATKINLNITYRLITRGIPLRALDVMAAGGFLLSNVQEELLENFRAGVDFACYENERDAVHQVEYFLTHEDERRKIAENGHNAVKRFDYGVQLDKILELVFQER